MATFIKKVIVGTPVKKVTAGSFDISNLGGVNISGDAGTGYNIGEGLHNDILVYDSAASEYRNLQTLRQLKIDQFTIDSNAITISTGSPIALDQLYINAPDGVFIDGRLEVDRINAAQLAVFDDSSLTTKFYVDQEIDKVKEVTFEMDDGFIDSLQIYDDETLRIAGGRGLSTRGVKIGNVLTITTDLDSTGADSGSFGSSIRIPVLTTNSRGQITTISDVAVASLDSISYDSSSGLFTINTSDGGVFSDSINLNPFTTADLIEGPADPQPATESYSFAVTASGNFFYSVTGSDRTGSISGGDPAIEIRTDDTITFNNSVSGDHPLYIKTVQGDGLGNQASGVTGAGTATVTWTPTTAGTYYYQCGVHDDMYGTITVTQRPGVPEANLYYRRSRFDSALGDNTSIATIRSYVGAEGDLQYDSTTGIFSVNVTQVYGKDDFDSDLDAAINNSYNIHWYPDSNYFDLGIKQSVDSGEYGSATLVPVITVDRYGRVDSIGTVSVAGVDSTSWDSAAASLVINTADGQEFRTIIGGYGDDQRLRFGNNPDLEIYHNSSLDRSLINAAGSGQIYMSGQNVYLGGVAGTTVNLKTTSGQGVELNYNSQKKFETTATGASVTGDLIPSADSTYDLGSATNKWKDLHLSGQTINLGTIQLKDSNGTFAIKTASGTPADLSLKYLSADSAYIGQLNVDSISISQLNLYNADMDSAYADQFNASQADIDSLHASQLDVDSAYITQLNVSQLDVDSINIVDGKAYLDSAYITQLNVATADIDSLHASQLSVDSAYITQLNLSQGDVDSLYADQLNATNVALSQVTIDSAHADRLDVAVAHIDEATVDSARIENLSVDILNADSVSADFIRFDPVLWDDNAKPTIDEGAVYYNSGPDALVYKPATASPVKVGQDEVTRVYNNTGAMIPRGAAVYVTGASQDFPTIAKAQADDITTIDATIGVLKDSINASSFGLVLNRGLIGRLDTSSYSVGDLLFVSADSAGKFTTSAPTYPNFAYEIGRVLVVDSQGGANVGGCIQISQQKEFFEEIRVTGSGRVDQNFTIGGNLTVIGSQIQTTTQSLAVDDTVIEMGAGDTIGAAGTNFGGTGQNDGVLIGHYTGDSVINYHVRIDSAGGTGDTIQWSYDSQYGTLETFDSAGGTGPTEFVLSAGSLVASLSDGVSIKFTAATGHDLNDSWSGEASPINVQIGIVGNYNPDDDSHAYSGLIRDPSDNRWKFFQQYLPDPQANVNFSHESIEFAPVQMETLYASTVNADLTGDVTGTVSDISNHTTTQLAEGTNLYYTDERVKAAIADSAVAVRFDADSGQIKQFVSDSAFITQLNVSQADIDSLFVDTLNVGSIDSAYVIQLNVSQADADSLYADQLNVSQADVDSLYADQLNVVTGDIDTFTSADATIDSAYIGQLNVATGDIDTLTSANAILDSAYIGQLNVSQADADSLYADQLNVSQADIDSLHASQLDVDSAYITQLHVSQAHIDSLFADNINLSTVDIDTLSADSAIITSISGDSAVFTDIVRSEATVIAGTYGTASLVPVLTVDSSGFVDSIGTVSVAGVTGFAWDSNTSTATISTADGASFPVIINGFGNNEYLNFGGNDELKIRASGSTGTIEANNPGGQLTLDANTHIILNTLTYVGDNLLPVADSSYDLGSSTYKWKDLYLSGSTINLGNVKLQDSAGGLKVMHTSGAMTQVKAGHLKADSAAVDLLGVLNDSNGDYRISHNTVMRSYENRDSNNLISGITQDSNNQGLVNIYVRTGFKTGAHRYWKQGSSKGYFMAYDSDDLYTAKEIQAPHLDLLPGVTYRFHHNDSSMSTHDIRFYWDDAKSGLVSDSAADIIYAGVAGNIDVGNSYAQIKVKQDGPRSLAYQCINHPYMGNSLNTNTTGGSRILGTSTGIKVDGDIDGIIDGGTY